MAMSKKDQDALKAAGDAWNAAAAKGDKAGMDAAHAQAEAIRNNYGYSGGSDGSQYISKPSQDLPRDDPNHWSSRPSGGSSSSGSRPSQDLPMDDPYYRGGSRSPVTGNFNGNIYEYIPRGAGSDFYANNVGMSKEDLDALSYAGKLWTDASASGNRIDMDRAHQIAEQIRGKYQYSGGIDGSEYISTMNYIPKTNSGGSSGGYKSKYEDLISDFLDGIMDRPAFSYDYREDPLYWQYKEVYEREGDRAMRDTLGIASAMTGGLASSYAIGAANQANNYYMAQLGDKIPELQQLAYSMYMDEWDTMFRQMGLLQDLDNTDYSRWNNDRNFNYGVYRDSISDSRYEDETAYNRWWEQYQYGHSNSIYEDETAYERALRKAETLAQFGNFSGYKDLGYTDAEIALMEQAYRQQMAAANTRVSESSNSNQASEEDEDNTYTEDEISAVAKGLLTDLRKYYASQQDQEAKARQEYESGGISWKDYLYLADQLGFGG